jgi:hypothetical protein
VATTRIYEIDWSGTGSNIFFIACCIFFAAGAALFLRIIVRNVRIVAHDNNSRTTWAGAGSMLIALISLVLFAVIGGVGANCGGAASGALGAGTGGFAQGYVRNVKSTSRTWLAVSLFGFPVLVTILISSGLFEQPLKLAVSANQVTMIYRLSWRDKSIPLKSITSVNLQRRNYLENGTMASHFYKLIIDQDGTFTRIGCNQRPWYEDQMKAAYEEIEANLQNSKGGAGEGS